MRPALEPYSPVPFDHEDGPARQPEERSNAEITRMLGVSAESVRRWKRVWEKGGTDALRRRTAAGRPPKLDDAQAEQVWTALEQGAQAPGSRLICGHWNGSAWSSGVRRGCPCHAHRSGGC
ncbi:helix-turn-helix domain-containing protein [Streptomyces sp. NPDC001774]